MPTGKRIQVAYEADTESNTSEEGLIIGEVVKESPAHIIAHSTNSFTTVKAFKLNNERDIILLLRESEQGILTQTKGQVLTTTWIE